MGAEKPLLEHGEPAGETDLPQPNTARPDLRRRLQVTRQIIFFSLITILAVFHIVNFVGKREAAKSLLDHDEYDATDPVNGYLSGVATKGMRKALCGIKVKKDKHLHGSKHGHKHHDNHHKHGKHDDKHDKGKHGMKMIPPKMAEKIFLSVPNNESCRA